MALPLKNGRDTITIIFFAPLFMSSFIAIIIVPPVAIISSAMRTVLPLTSPRRFIDFMFVFFADVETIE